MTASDTRSLCPYCGVGCGLIVRTEAGRVRSVAGDHDYPVNRGRTCRKPIELASAVHAADRALTPLVRERRDARFERAGWDEVLPSLASRLEAIATACGPEALGFYISGQLLSEDYYVISKLAKGFLGTNNVDSNSRLCMSSAVAGYTGAFGSDGPPGAYADIEHADCFLLLGSNAAACHPILWARIRDRQREGAFVICVDPRPTATAQSSDLHLPVRPGADLALLNAMLSVIDAEGLLDRDFIGAHTNGFEETIAAARELPLERAAEVAGVRAELIVEAARRFGGAPAALAMWSMGANQSTVGTLKNRALINLCLATGSLGRPGAAPFSLTGQPNAMGGRETGGLAHLLPGYRKVEDAADREAMRVLWAIPDHLPGIAPEPGLPAVELFEAAAEGRVKALWIVATNPVVSMPDTALVRAALERAELVVVQDAHHPTETSALAHVMLPAAAWPEKEGTMTNSERRVGLVRRALCPPGEARPDWQIFASLAAALGYGEHFAWPDAAAVFAEHVRCTAGRLCDMTGVSHERLQREGGLQWPCLAGLDAGPTERLYAQLRVGTSDGRARMAPTPHAGPAETRDASYPLLLSTGRVADQWHTMTRTGKSAALRAAAPEPLLELHPRDASRAGIGEGDFAMIRSRRGELRMRVRLAPGLAPGTAFAPFHWGALHAPAGAGVLNATSHRAVDPISAQPELKVLAVRVEAAKSDRPVAHRFLHRHAEASGGRAAQRVGVGGASVRRLVIVGTGMSGLAVAEEARRRRGAQELAVTLLGEEPDPPYNRILVSKLLAGTCGRPELQLRPEGWYAAQGIDLRCDCHVEAIDLTGQVVIDGSGERHPYHSLVLATGSRPFMPPIPGAERAHVRTLRTPADVHSIMRHCARGARRAVVIGGGLLGLEAAAGVLTHGVQTTLVELAPRLMPQQLDDGASRTLGRTLAGLALETRLGRAVGTIADDRVVLDDGEEIEASLVLVAVGVRPEVSLARKVGIECARGIVVDDELRTSAPKVWSVGECAEHRGTVHGLWAPLAEQARVAAASAVGDPAAFHGLTAATTLKVAGVQLFAGGELQRTEGYDEVLSADSRNGRYRKLVLVGKRLAGAVLVGDVADARELSALLRSGDAVPEALLIGSGTEAPEVSEDPEALVCSCNAVKRGQIIDAIRRGGLTTAAQVGNATRAGTGCGSCTAELEALLARSSARNMDEMDTKSLHTRVLA